MNDRHKISQFILNTGWSKKNGPPVSFLG